MRLERHVSKLVSLANHRHIFDEVASCYSARYYTDKPNCSNVKDLAVVGGGITGLTTAFYARRLFPSANIVLYEAESRVGGWLQSKHVEVEDGTILFEQGPRTLRSKTLNALATVSLIQDVGLSSEIIGVPEDAPSAKNRYVYYPDHLVRLPTLDNGILKILYSLFTEPLLRSLPSSVVHEGSVPRRPDSLEDESLRSFFTRRFSRQVADNAVSAFVHGVYAGDIEKLSVKSIMPQLWYAEGKYGSIMRMLLNKGLANFGFPEDNFDTTFRKKMQTEIWKDDALRKLLKSSNVISLRRGLESLTTELRKKLIESGVTIREGFEITGLTGDKDSKTLHINTSSQTNIFPSSHVVFTIPPKQVSEICRDSSSSSSKIPSLSQIPSVSVMLVNLYFRTSSALPVRGFGYLIPRSIPFDQNPGYALGVTFDSDAMPGQDTAAGTKVTVMFGGHWWDGWHAFPDKADAKAMAQTVLARHLGITEEPECVNVALQKDCIPQYVVGHQTLLRKAQKEITEAYGGKVFVAGSAYGGVGVNDCVRNAIELVNSLRTPNYMGAGLSRFIDD